MSDDHAAHIDKHVKIYMIVFASLLVLTVATVGAAKIDIGVAPGIALGLAIATVKGSLVALFFMHLKGEKRWITWTMILTMFFFFVLLMLPFMDFM